MHIVALQFDAAKRWRTRFFLVVSILVGFALGWLVNTYTLDLWPQFGEWPGGVLAIVWAIGTYRIALKWIRIRCGKKTCKGIYEEESWWSARKKRGTRYTCSTCGKVEEVEFPDEWFDFIP